jgi:PIN domain nuclease of toxin-antitoxin system
MIALVLDTHSIIWLLHADARLSPTAHRQIDAATTQGQQAATAVNLGVPLVSRDGKIRDSQIQTIWD